MWQGGLKTGDRLGCAVTARDDELDAEPVRSSVVTVLNSAPEVLAVHLEPAELRTHQPVKATVQANDDDGDTLAMTYSWKVDGVNVGDDAMSLKASHFRRDQAVSVVVTANDGQADSVAFRSQPVLVQSTPPSQPGILLSNPAGGLNDLQCVVDEVSYDADADKVTYQFDWLVDGKPHKGAVATTEFKGDTIPSAQVEPGQRWQCIVTPSDGSVMGEPGRASQLVIAPVLAAGSAHTCLLTSDGEVACWGADTEGQLAAPTKGPYIQIASNGWHSCVLDAEGHPTCWGSNKYGQSNAPSDEAFVDLIAGLAHTCGRRKDDTVTCWGNDDDGRTSPPVEAYRMIAGGGLHSCGVTFWGNVVCWGKDDVGQTRAVDGDYQALSSVSGTVVA